MNEQHTRLEGLVSELKHQRDEIKLKIHLGEMELKDEWDKLEEKFHQMTADYDPAKRAVAETSEDVWESLEQVALELKDGFKRVWKAL